MSAATTKLKGQLRPWLYFKHIIRKVFLEDWFLKLVALLITLGLWLGVTGLSTPATKRLTVPLVPYVADNAQLSNFPTNSVVDIVVSGDERKLRTLSSNGMEASLDLTRLSPGDRTVSLTPETVAVQLPDGVKLDQITPPQMTVKIEDAEVVDMPVAAVTDGAPANGFELYSTSVLPQTVPVRGSSAAITALGSVPTQKISLAGRSADFTVPQVHLNAPTINYFDATVDVFVKIGEKRVDRSMTLPISGSTPARKAVVDLHGPRNLLNTIRPDMLRVESIKSDSGQETLHVDLPPELQQSIEVKSITRTN